MALWDTIKEIRVKAGKTQTEFGDMLGGVTKPHICNIERSYEQTRITASESLLKKSQRHLLKQKKHNLHLKNNFSLSGRSY